MALRSMTGFGRGDASASGMKVEVELSSVNRKQFDMRISLPRALFALESRLQEVVHAKLSRGHITGMVRISASGSGRRKAVSVDMDAVAAYVSELRAVAALHDLRDDLSASVLLQLPAVIEYKDIAEDTERVWRLLKRAANQALRQLLTMRTAEGCVMEKDLMRRFDGLQRTYEEIQSIAPAVTERYIRSLRKRIARAGGVRLASDDPSMLKEIALFADRSDVSEEIVRLGSHFKQVLRLMKSRQPAGRALDFLCQEMFREINTIGSKANDAAMSRRVIEFRANLETIREQVQNVE